MLVGNKSDLSTQRKTSRELGEEFAKEEELLFIEASAKSGEGVEELFMEIGTSFFLSFFHSSSFSFPLSRVFLPDSRFRDYSLSRFAILKCLFVSGLDLVTMADLWFEGHLSMEEGSDLGHVPILTTARKLPLAPPKPAGTSNTGKVKVSPNSESSPSACNC